MIELISRYTRWLHTRWPAGTVEKLPLVNDDGSTNVPGVYIVGDLTGVPLLKFSADTGARAVHTITDEASFASRDTSGGVIDVAIVGGGVSGFSAALEAKNAGLSFKLFEATEPFSTIVNFPKAKPIFTYPTDMSPAGSLQFHAKSDVKEGLLDDLQEQTIEAGIEPVHMRIESVKRTGRVLQLHPADGEPIKAHRVIVAIGRSGNYRRLGVPGEDRDKVYNRLHDPADYRDQNVTVVGGGDSAMETAIALAECGSNVTLSYRKPQFSRPKPQNVDKLNHLAGDGGKLRLLMASNVREIRDGEIVIRNSDGEDETIDNDAVFSMIGREPPLDFFRRSGIHLSGEWRASSYISFVLFLLFCVWMFHWKSGKIPAYGIDPTSLWNWLASHFKSASEPGSLLHTLKISASGRSFYYTLAYCACVLVFGIRRIKRRKTPYVKVQTFVLTAIQLIPLFLLPEIILPYLGHNGVFDGGGWWIDGLFPPVDYGHGREYWRAYGFILAWPLMIYNWFTPQPLGPWLVIGVLQTFVIIPALIYRYGKGVYCGWICSCGALAETMGDMHRHKMPHGPIWNRLNMIGQVFLGIAMLLMALRVFSWLWPGTVADDAYHAVFTGIPILNYAWFVDLLWAGIIGVGFYFWFSGRVWCRFACPLAALMHIYTRFSQFRILADKKKCISCNACTSVCHQGIDIMNFANKGQPMEDPQCVRCSACVQSCPTGVLSFGRVDTQTGDIIARDSLAASPVRMTELTVNGKKPNQDGLNRKLWAAAAVLALMVGGSMWAASGGERTAMAAATSQPAASQPATSQPAGTDAVSHDVFDEMLRAHVRDERVDYLMLRKQHYGQLSDYLQRMGQANPGALSRNGQLAFYINLYNAGMIKAVIDRHRAGYSPADDNFAVFNDNIVPLQGRMVSLDHIEKRIIIPRFGEPRIHVAVVCGARSCPPLIARAYRGRDIEAVLETNMGNFIAHDPFRNRFEAGKMHLSKIFDWYAADFGGKANVPKYVNRYNPENVADYVVLYLDYSWDLNIAAPASGRWVVVDDGKQVYEVVDEKDGRLLLDRPLQGDQQWVTAQSTSPFVVKSE
jgi:thioredoxin reductase/polyferredoxin